MYPIPTVFVGPITHRNTRAWAYQSVDNHLTPPAEGDVMALLFQAPAHPSATRDSVRSRPPSQP